MAYRWHYTKIDGDGTAGPEAGFADQADAEEWLSSNWAQLLEDGVDEVTLLDGDGDEVYGPMSLHPPQAE